MSAGDRHVSPESVAEGVAAGSPALTVVPEWPCLCGARNRLRDLACRNCGAPKP